MRRLYYFWEHKDWNNNFSFMLMPRLKKENKLLQFSIAGTLYFNKTVRCQVWMKLDGDEEIRYNP
jgi:hypothetical protein